jgi:amino acid adenylation domain-containing protein
MLEKVLAADTYSRLRSLAQNRRVTLNTLFVAAWSLLLSRYCDTPDVVFGATCAGRPPELPGVERMAGLFINTPPVRVQMQDDDTVGGLVSRIQKEQAARRVHEQTPLADAQRYSEVAPGTPLFETILVFENFPDLGETRIEQAPVVSDEQVIEYSNFPLALLVVPEDDLRLIAVYHAARFGRVAIEAMLGHLEVILYGMLDDPDGLVCELPLLNDKERVRIVDTWNDTARARDAQANVVALFEQCADRTPDAVAVTAGATQLRYGELDRQANRLAHRLRQCRGHDDAPVIVYTERNGDAIVAMLGALKAGAAYVPLNVNDPVERLQQVIDDLTAAQPDGVPPLIVTHGALAARVPQGTPRVLLDADLDSQPDTRTGVRIDPDSLAYVIYTSGSTGRPKGVMVSHRSLANSTLARFDYYVKPVSVYALLSSLATDSAIAGIYWTLCCGGNLVIPEGRAELDIEQLGILIERHAVSHTLCAPSLYALLLEHGDPARLTSLDTVIVAGEACPASLIGRHCAALPGAALHNEYGPSEACVWASVARLDERDDVTIGRPIANTRLYVLDSHLRPVPAGVTGELYIGGANVARGYLGRISETEASFLPDIFSTNPLDRLYRSGDRARYRSDGRIEFLGRVDHQLKVRGYRVEPGEVESVLAAHPDIADAVVLIDETTDIDAELEALLDATDGATVSRILSQIEALDDIEAETALTHAGAA